MIGHPADTRRVRCSHALNQGVVAVDAPRMHEFEEVPDRMHASRNAGAGIPGEFQGWLHHGDIVRRSHQQVERGECLDIGLVPRLLKGDDRCRRARRSALRKANHIVR